MNRHDLPKVTSSIGRDLSQMAITREIQKIFNLTPQILAGEVLQSARTLRRNPVYHAQEIKCDALCVFSAVFAEINKAVGSVDPDLLELEQNDPVFNHPLARHFKLYPRRIAREIVRRAAEIKYPAQYVSEYYLKSVPDVVRFSFDEVIVLLEKDLIFAQAS